MNKIMALTTLACLIGTLILSTGCRKKQSTPSTKKPSAGTLAPDFSLPDENNTMHTLSAMRGSKVALYFYPKDETPGCTAQACSIRDAMGELKNQGITVWGISYDSPESHKNFKRHHHLTFTLLSDVDSKVAALYDVKGMLLNTRRTFLIDAQGYIVGVIRDVDTAHHAEQIVDGFNKLK